MKSISISDNPGWLVGMHTECHTADVEGKGGIVISTEQVFGEFETLRWEEGLLQANHPCMRIYSAREM